MAKNPDYLIIGAQKSGTTSLFHYLSKHPQVNNPSKKEIHYFDLNVFQPLSWYQSFFSGNENTLSGEATPFYLYGYSIPKRIYLLLPKVKVIVLLRNPVDRAYSHFQMQKARKIEQAKNFEQAIALEEDRLSFHDPNNVDNQSAYIHFSYLDRGNYYAQLLRWNMYYDISKFHYVFSEDLFKDPQTVFNETCAFLDIDNYSLRSIPEHFSQDYKPMKNKTRKGLSLHFNTLNKKLFSLINKSYDWE